VSNTANPNLALPTVHVTPWLNSTSVHSHPHFNHRPSFLSPYSPTMSHIPPDNHHPSAFHGVPMSFQEVDTSPQALGLDPPNSSDQAASPKSQSRVLRAVEKTVDMIGKSIPTLPSRELASPASPKRVFSLNRRGKDKQC
jgi:hypothetical protein